MHCGGRSNTGQDAAHHGMMLSVVPRSQQRSRRSRRPTDDNVPVSQSKHGEHCSATRVLSFNRSSSITGRIPLTHVTVSRRPYGPSCGRCYSHSLITLPASLLTTTRNTSRRRSIAFAHRQRHCKSCRRHVDRAMRSSTNCDYFVRRTNLRLGDRAFSVAAPEPGIGCHQN